MTDRRAIWKLAGSLIVDDDDFRTVYADGYCDGAAAMAGLIGMAEAIRQRERERPRRELDEWYQRNVEANEQRWTK